MKFEEFIRQLQGHRTQQEMADLLGITQPQWSRLLSSTRRPGLATMRGLIVAFPEHRETILAFFLSCDKTYQTVTSPISMEEPA